MSFTKFNDLSPVPVCSDLERVLEFALCVMVCLNATIVELCAMCVHHFEDVFGLLAC